jgi:hypothetical protein
MDKPRELYHEEVENLNNFKSKLDTHAIYRDDVQEFCDQKVKKYQCLRYQSNVMLT